MANRLSDRKRDVPLKKSVTAPTSEVVQYLRKNLGISPISVLAAVDGRTVSRWLAGNVVPREEAERRIRSAYQIFHLLVEKEASSTARAWFMGMNEQLDDLSPIEAIAAGRSRDALIAARSFISYG